MDTWIAVLVVEIITLIFLTILLLCLVKTGVESVTMPEWIGYIFKTALIIKLKAILNMKSNNGFKSQPFKITSLSLSSLGLIILSYYKAQLNAALNVDINKILLKNWNDVEKSGYKILLWMDSAFEEKFSFAQKEVLTKIYEEQIKSVPTNLQLQNIGFQAGIQLMINEKYLTYSVTSSQTRFPEYPCVITMIDEPELV